jgi:hypothetical protein
MRRYGPEETGRRSLIRMRRVLGVLLASVVVAAAGFAVASIASGARLLDILTGTTETTATTATTTTAPTTTGAGGRTATVCHLTGSKKHPAVTITVAQNAVAAVIKGGGHLGPCTGTETSRTHVKGSANGLGKGHTATTTTTTSAPVSTTTTSSPSGQDNGHGNNGSGHGNNGSGHGRGK